MRAENFLVGYIKSLTDYHRKHKESVSLAEFLEVWNDENIWKSIDNESKVQEIFKFVSKLKAEHKQILIMRLWDELSYKEISEITGKSVANCKTIVSRNIEKIRWEVTLLLLFLLIL